MTDVQLFADRLAHMGIEINLCGKRENRLWFWPEAKYKALSPADRAFEKDHRTELKELVRSGLAPRLDAIQAIQAAKLDCPYCRRVCVGQSHPAYDVLHGNDPEVIARRDKAATAVMFHMVKFGTY